MNFIIAIYNELEFVFASKIASRDSHQQLSPAPTPTTSHPKESAGKLSARHERVRELFHTEKNYVGILHTILKVTDGHRLNQSSFGNT